MYESQIQRWSKIPIVSALSMQVLDVQQGVAEILVPRPKEMDGVFECFHGGLLLTVADTLACLAIMSHTGPDRKMTTTDMNIRFLAPCYSSVRAVAKVIKAGKTLCPVQVDLYDETSKHVAIAQINYMLL